MKYKEIKLLLSLRYFQVSIGFLAILLGCTAGISANNQPGKVDGSASHRYVLMPSDVADVLFEASQQACEDCPTLLRNVSRQIACGVRTCRWNQMMAAIDSAMVRVDDTSKAVLIAYRNELERQSEAGKVMTVPATYKRSFICSPSGVCSGAAAPSFGDALDILNSIRLSGCTSPCPSGLFNFECIDPNLCPLLLQDCFFLAANCLSGCGELRESLSGVCADLDRVDQVSCTGTPFSGLPFNLICPVCPPAVNPQLPVFPVLPAVPGGSKTLICDLRVLTIEANTGLFGELGVEEDINVLGSGIFGGNLDVDGDALIGGSLDVGADIIASGSLQVAGDGLFNGSVCINGDVRVNDSLCVGDRAEFVGDVAIGNRLIVNKDITAGGRICALGGLCASAPICANDIIARRIKSDYACIDNASIDRLTSELACFDLACVSELGAGGVCVESLFAATACITSLNVGQSRTVSACANTLRVADLVAGQVCLDNTRISTLNASTACLGNMYADRIGSLTAIIDNIDICQAVVEDLFINNIVQYNGSLSGLCWPQGFGEIIFPAKMFCLPLCPDGPVLGQSGCAEFPGSYAWWPYDFTLCAAEELVCGAPVPRCQDEVAGVGRLPHVDFVVPADYAGQWELDVYIFFPAGVPMGLYELQLVGSRTAVTTCAEVSLPAATFLPTTLSPCNRTTISPTLTRFTITGLGVEDSTLFSEDWIRLAFGFSVAPQGFDANCPPQISSMVFRYSRVDINEAAAIFPG